MKVAILGLCIWGLAAGQTPGTFTATGSMNVARVGHTATLLGNGKVLIAGGSNSNGFLSTAELYDPSTGTFTRTGDMLAVELGHTAILLPDGRVLIAGGTSDTSDWRYFGAGAEVYDPSTGTFASTGKPVAPLSGPKGVLIGNGKVLLVGYNPYSGSIIDICIKNATINVKKGGARIGGCIPVVSLAKIESGRWNG